MKINELIWQAAREYARQFGEVLGVGPEFWIADQPWMCSFGDCYFFTLEEMAGVVDNMDKHIERWGSREAVGDQIREWVDWWLESDLKACDHERLEERVTHQLRVNINLGSWLAGCPREGREPFEGPDATYYRHLNERDTLRRLIEEYRENRTLGNVLASIETMLDIEAQAKATRDFEAFVDTVNHFNKTGELIIRERKPNN